jgi:RHS repeat-associated protein
VYHAAGNAGRGSSSYIDSVILRDRDMSNGWTGAADGTLEERRYLLQNWRADVVAVTKSNGDPLEYVFYSPYGEPIVHPVADIDMDGDVDVNDLNSWANGAASGASDYTSDINFDDEPDAYDDALFDESYAANLGLNGRGLLTTPGVGNRKGYAGYEHDESLTMYHVRHRVYRADLGRWMTRDPLGYVDGMGLYEYVGGMAVRGSDPSGLRSMPCFGGVCLPGDVSFADDGYDDFIDEPLADCVVETANINCERACNAVRETGRCPWGITPSDNQGRPANTCCVCTRCILRRIPDLSPGIKPGSPAAVDLFGLLHECTNEHEKEHLKQCGGSGACRECAAYKVEVSCLKTRKDAWCRGDEMCLLGADAVIRDAEEKARVNCGRCWGGDEPTPCRPKRR